MWFGTPNTPIIEFLSHKITGAKQVLISFIKPLFSCHLLTYFLWSFSSFYRYICFSYKLTLEFTLPGATNCFFIILKKFQAIWIYDLEQFWIPVGGSSTEKGKFQKIDKVIKNKLKMFRCFSVPSALEAMINLPKGNIFACGISGASGSL